MILWILLISSGVYLYSQYKAYRQLSQAHDANEFKNIPECPEPQALVCVEGKMPSWLNGIMYRIGPGTFNIPQDNGLLYTIRHAFDGLPTVHRFQIQGATNSILHRSRHTAKGLQKKIESGGMNLIFFGHHPSLSFVTWSMQALWRLIQLLLNPLPLTPDSASVSVTVSPNYPLPAHRPAQNALVAKTDANLLQTLDPITLEPQSLLTYQHYHPRLNGIFAAAHHQQDPVTEETFNFTMHLLPPSLKVFKTDPKGHVTLLADIAGCTSYIHSFYLTPHYVILPASPLTYDSVSHILVHGTALSSLRWHPDRDTVLYLVPRDGQPVQTLTCAPFFSFHVANAFECQGRLVLDSAAFTDATVLLELSTFGLLEPGQGLPQTWAGMKTAGGPQRFGQLIRHTLDLTQRRVQMEVITHNLEFPRFNSTYNTQPYRFVYGCRRADNNLVLTKVDLHNQKTLTFEAQGHCAEPIFVPRPAALAEDDGVLLSLLNTCEKAYWILLDARTMKLLARFSLGNYQPITFHGSFVDYEFQSISVN